jgi:hypothetical protein
MGIIGKLFKGKNKQAMERSETSKEGNQKDSGNTTGKETLQKDLVASLNDPARATNDTIIRLEQNHSSATS